jgi:ATP-dependent protease ClpP protease subunit
MMTMSKPTSAAEWADMRAQVAGALARGECDHAEGRQALAAIDAQLAGRQVTAPTSSSAGVFRYAPRSAAARPGYFAFFDRFSRARNAAKDIGNGGLVTETNGVTELRIYGAIGAGFGIGPADVARALDEHGIERVRLNSPGGDVFDGIAIANMVEKAGLPVVVDGVAASIASVIAASSPHVTMMTGTFLMAHKAWSAPVGNADEIRKEAAVLDKLDDTMSRLYARKAGETPKAWLSRMAAETWYSAEEAVTAGLADVQAEDVAAGLNAALAFDMANYHARVPHALRRTAA